MSTKYLNWCSATQITCDVDFPIAVYLQVPVIVMAEPEGDVLGIIDGVITQIRESTAIDTCGCGNWVYTISYDDADVDDSLTLEAKYVDTVLFIGGNIVLRAG